MIPLRASGIMGFLTRREKNMEKPLKTFQRRTAARSTVGSDGVEGGAIATERAAGCVKGCSAANFG